MKKSLVWFAASLFILQSGPSGFAASTPPTSPQSAPSAAIRQKLRSAKVRGSVLMLFGKSQGEPISVLVYLKEKADLSGAAALQSREAKGRFVYDALRAAAAKSQKDLIASLTANNLSFHPYYVTNMVTVENATPDLVAELAARPDVEHVSGNPQVKMQHIVNYPAAKIQQTGPDNLETIGAKRVWNELGVRGENIVVAGQDTGVQWDHPGLKAAYRGTNPDGTANHDYNWHDAVQKPVGPPNVAKCPYNGAAPCDDEGGEGVGHGTHTMGTMVGNGGPGNEVGVAPKAQWIACRNMDNGMGRPNLYIECFEFFLAPYKFGANPMTEGDPSKAPNVMNNSWGCPVEEGCEGDEIKPVLQAMSAAGIMVVASAGNSGPGCSTVQDPPAWHSADTFSVGALDHRTGVIAGFSSRGPSLRDGELGPDVSAPGVQIRSTVPGGGYADTIGGIYPWSGTSMAGPHVAGVVALIWSAKPSLIGKIEETSELIRKTADAKTIETESCGGVAGTAIPNNTYGYGMINAFKAVSAVR